ncbi:hypothetical protein WSM22_34770 [Cytophagales bacterium WSM2-2]|nr:hypothetical protein WSM22_34770 [Cytophagales bacterium WSM2-2]
MKKIIPLLAFCLASVSSVVAQTESTLTFMNSLPQVVYNNPAIIPKYKVSVGLPGSSVMAYYSNNAFTYNDAIKHEHDSVKADLPKLYGNLKPNNYITQALHLDLFRLGIKINSRLYITLNSTAKVYNRLLLPKDLMGVFINGNAAYIGQTASLSPKAESVTFLETAVGGSYRVNEKLTVGARLKILKGITNVTTKSATLNLQTDASNYALTATGAMDVRTSGIYNFTQSGFDFGSSYKNYLNNNGFGVDLGATYKVMDRITLGASLIDIGTIHWQNNTYGYSLDPKKASYTFDGVDLSKVVNGNTDYLNSLGDTLQNKFKVKEAPIGAYNSPIPGRAYLSGMYEMPHNFTAGAVVFMEKFKGRFNTGITLGANKHLGRIVSVAASYSIASNSFKNVGAGVSFNLAPFQLYMVGDNLLSIAMSGKELNNFTNNTQFFNVRAGLNFVWGWDRIKREKRPKDGSTPTGQLTPEKEESKSIRRKLYKNYTPDKVRKR